MADDGDAGWVLTVVLILHILVIASLYHAFPAQFMAVLDGLLETYGVYGTAGLLLMSLGFSTIGMHFLTEFMNRSSHDSSLTEVSWEDAE